MNAEQLRHLLRAAAKITGEREFRVNDPTDTIGWCLEKHDLAFSKLAAGRTKDIGFLRELLKQRLINRGKIQRLIESEENDELKRLLVRNWTIVTSQAKP